MAGIDFIAVAVAIDALLLQYLVALLYVSLMVADAARLTLSRLAYSLAAIVAVVCTLIVQPLLAMRLIIVAVVLPLLLVGHFFAHRGILYPNISP